MKTPVEGDLIGRLLLPVGLAKDHMKVGTTASDLATHYGASVTLLHVIETVDNVPFEDLRDFYDRLQRKAESLLAELEQAYYNDTISTHRAIVYGKRLEQIIDYAREDESDLILMSSHAIEEDRQHPRWGSLSHGVAILAPCSVMLLR